MLDVLAQIIFIQALDACRVEHERVELDLFGARNWAAAFVNERTKASP